MFTTPELRVKVTLPHGQPVLFGWSANIHVALNPRWMRQPTFQPEPVFRERLWPDSKPPAQPLRRRRFPVSAFDDLLV